LTNPTYTGRIHNGASTLPGEHDAIVDQSTADEVQRQLASRKTRASSPGERKANPRPKALLRGILICGDCNRPMSTSISQKGSIRYPYYRCRSTADGQPPCPGVNVQCYKIETLICEVLAEPPKDNAEELRALTVAWNQLDKHSQRATLPLILSRVVFQLSTGEMTLELAEGAAERIGNVTDVECE
jgi:site-specific DNA recombinase